MKAYVADASRAPRMEFKVKPTRMFGLGVGTVFVRYYMGEQGYEVPCWVFDPDGDTTCILMTHEEWERFRRDVR